MTRGSNLCVERAIPKERVVQPLLLYYCFCLGDDSCVRPVLISRPSIRQIMAPKFPSSLEDTISIYKNKLLIDLDDENDDAPLLDSIDEALPETSGERDLRTEHESQDSGDNNRIPKSRLPRDLTGLMGQANVSFARGEINDAILMCQEVIRLAPRCAEPFISLAEHYENEDEEKAEQLYLIAAYLQPSNTHLWKTVAELATKRRELRLAATCYTKAIRAEKNDPCIEFQRKRCELYEQLGDLKKALRGYENLITALAPDDKKLDIARSIARIQKGENKIDDCQKTLEDAFQKYSDQLTGEDVAQLCQCYNLKSDYLKTIDMMVQRCQVTIKFDDDSDWNMEKLASILRDDPKQHQLSIKLDPKSRRFNFNNRCLLLVALLSLGINDNTITPLTDNLEPGNLVSHRQSLYDVARAYFAGEFFTEAKNILYGLTTFRDSQAASVWLLYSQCLKNLSEINEAIEGYRKVLSYDPDDFGSRLALSNLLSVQGRLDEALQITRQPLFTDKPVDIALLYQSCLLLEQIEDWNGYCESAKALILTDMFHTSHPREIMCMITSKSHKTRLDNLRAVHREINHGPQCHRQKSIGEKLDPETLLKTFLRYINVLFHVKKDYQEIIRTCFSAYTCTSFECYESSIDFYSAVSCVVASDKDFTYNHLKILASRNPDHYQVWNMLSIAMCNIYQDLRHGRFCLRQFLKNPDILPLAIFNGHNALMSGSYKYALGEYISVFRERPNDPMAAFCIAITFLSLSCQRYVSSKYLCLFQMIAFLHTYLELRGTCQEAMYNIGRVFHQMNMLDKAVIFYKKALSMNQKHQIQRLAENDDEFEEIFDVRREAAFNLALIYKNSQSYELAYHVIKDNFTI